MVSYQGFNYHYNNKIVPRLPSPKMIQIFIFFVNPKIQPRPRHKKFKQATKENLIKSQ